MAAGRGKQAQNLSHEIRWRRAGMLHASSSDHWLFLPRSSIESPRIRRRKYSRRTCQMPITCSIAPSFPDPTPSARRHLRVGDFTARRRYQTPSWHTGKCEVRTVSASAVASGFMMGRCGRAGGHCGDGPGECAGLLEVWRVSRPAWIPREGSRCFGKFVGAIGGRAITIYVLRTISAPQDSTIKVKFTLMQPPGPMHRCIMHAPETAGSLDSSGTLGARVCESLHVPFHAFARHPGRDVINNPRRERRYPIRETGPFATFHRANGTPAKRWGSRRDGLVRRMQMYPQGKKVFASPYVVFTPGPTPQTSQPWARYRIFTTHLPPPRPQQPWSHRNSTSPPPPTSSAPSAQSSGTSSSGPRSGRTGAGGALTASRPP